MRSAAEADPEKLRAALFGHISGLVLVPTLRCLWQWGVLHLFTTGRGWVSLDEIVTATRGNRSYLRIAMRLLTTCGWMHEQRADRRGPLYAITAQGKLALRIAPALYAQAHDVLLYGQQLDDLLCSNAEDGLFEGIQQHIAGARQNWFASPSAYSVEAEVYEQVRGHLDGLLVGPVMVLLARRGILADMEQGPVDIESLGGLANRWQAIFGFLELLGWAHVDAGHVELTAAGRYVAQIATSYGVPVSYLPLYHQLDRLLFSVVTNGEAVLVDRGIHVWARGRAQRTYFEKVDEIVMDLFNRPLDQQPLGICDMGCGDGTFLEHLYAVIATRTARGQALDTHPIFVVGADLSEVARGATSQRLQAAGIPKFHVIHGDIANPDQMALDLNALGLDARGFLHVRSFLDHNRAYRPPVGYSRGTRIARTAGAFAQRGTEILADFLEENLVRHLRAWVPYCERFGLLLMERHTLAPEVTAANLDKTPAAAYDGFLGYSDQYLVELAVFHDCLREAGFRSEAKYQAMFPKSELATISIDLLVGAAA